MPDRKSCTLFFVLAIMATTGHTARCLYISSYYTGHAWSDGVEHGLLKELEGHCEITTFNMGTKRNKDEASIKKAALEARALIEKIQPDVVIASDDNASKYLIVPYYKDADIPFVFCGVNWSVEQYGFPFTNVTGMIEVAAIEPMLKKASAITGKIRKAYYIGADTLSEQKNTDRFVSIGEKNNINVIVKLVSTTSEWLDAYREAQKTDLVIIGDNASISNWNKDAVLEAIRPVTKTLSVTNHGWMMPYAMFGLTKIPEEHGEWAGKMAREILNGVRPIDIPIIPNRNFDTIVNNSLLSISKIKLPEFIKLKAQPYY